MSTHRHRLEPVADGIRIDVRTEAPPRVVVSGIVDLSSSARLQDALARAVARGGTVEVLLQMTGLDAVLRSASRPP